MDFLKGIVIPIKDFHKVSSEERLKIDSLIEQNYSNSGNSFPILDDDSLFFSTLYEKYKKLCYELFNDFHISEKNQTTCWCYRSSIDQYVSRWHNHLYTSTINGVYYYQVDGDGIFFDHHGEEYHYIPQQEELIIFPNYLKHKPDITTSKNRRYSINMEIITEESSSKLFKRYLNGLS